MVSILGDLPNHLPINIVIQVVTPTSERGTQFIIFSVTYYLESRKAMTLQYRYHLLPTKIK